MEASDFGVRVSDIGVSVERTKDQVPLQITPRVVSHYTTSNKNPHVPSLFLSNIAIDIKQRDKAGGLTSRDSRLKIGFAAELLTGNTETVAANITYPESPCSIYLLCDCAWVGGETHNLRSYS